MSKQDSKLPAAKRFVYPFPGKDGKEIRDVGVYYKALAKAGEGYYPIGANGQWHGGVHFNNQTAAELDQKNGVRCIADGEVVAWRLDDTYPCVDYPVATDEDGEEVHGKLRAVYSTGFVLVRHRLEPPEASGKHNSDNTKGATASTDTDTKSSGQPSLTFYSLYMHLMCWDNYNQHINRERPTFWDGKITYRVGDDANDACGKNSPNEFARTSHKKGINLRKKGAHGAYAGFAPKGSIFRLGAAEANGFYEVESVEGDSVNPQNVNDAVVYKKELTASPGKPETLGTVAVPDEPIAVKAGQLMGHLGIYERFKDAKPVEEATKPNADAATSNRQMMHLEVFTADDIKTFIEKSRKRSEELPDADKTLLLIERGAQLAEPTAADMSIDGNNGVVVVGDENTSGYWTRVKRLSNRAIIPHQHCTGFENNQYTLQSGANAELTRQLGLTAAELTRTARWDGYYYGTDGTPNTKIPRYQAHGNNNDEYPNRGVHVVLAGEAWIESSYLNDTGAVEPTGTTLPAWNEFPLDTGNTDAPRAGSQTVVKVSTLDGLAKNKDGVRWWQVTIRTEAGNNATGWACEKDQDKVHLCSPWTWPGFEALEETTSPAELHAYRLMGAVQVRPEEEADAKSLAQKAQTGALLTRLHEILGLNEDDKVTPGDIRTALKSKQQAQELSHLIVRHESEWGGKMAKWSALDKFMKGPFAGDWEEEKIRIENLQYLDKAKNITSTDLWHLQPQSFIGNFQNHICYPLDKAQELALLITAGFEDSTATTLHYDAVAGNFDGQGMSFGVIQWNFGQNTLAPVLLEMINKNEKAFKSSFTDTDNYNSLKKALNSNTSDQLKWANSQQKNNPSTWKRPFKAIGKIKEFNEIQLKHAAKFHNDVMVCIQWLRGIRNDLMQNIELESYCALYDLCVQQGSLAKSHKNITTRVNKETPKTQKDLIVIAITERGKTASTQFRADCISRRMGILQQKPYSASMNGHNSKRTNPNFETLRKDALTHVCKI